jgi:hypothetical protein
MLELFQIISVNKLQTDQNFMHCAVTLFPAHLTAKQQSRVRIKHRPSPLLG